MEWILLDFSIKTLSDGTKERKINRKWDTGRSSLDYEIDDTVRLTMYGIKQTIILRAKIAA